MGWIFFDAVGTLFGVRGSVGTHYARAASVFGVHADPCVLQQAFQEVFDASKPLVAPPGGNVSEFERQWWKELVSEVCRRSGMALDAEVYSEYLFGTFASARCWQLYPEAAATLKMLARDGHRIGIISNFDSRLSLLLKELGLQSWIAQVTTSAGSGTAKPEAEIFLKACTQAGTEPSLAWHTGDSPLYDYYGALSAGMQAVLLDREDSHPSFEGQRVKRLSSLVGKLRKKPWRYST